MFYLLSAGCVLVSHGGNEDLKSILPAQDIGDWEWSE